MPDLAARLLTLIEQEESRSRRFQDALANFIEICRGTINPNISKAAVREMLIQHLLTERIFRRVFDNSDFAQRNRRTWVVVSYDIPDDKRRTKVMKTLEGYGRRAQYSVFECELRPAELTQLKARLRDQVPNPP